MEIAIEKGKVFPNGESLFPIKAISSNFYLQFFFLGFLFECPPFPKYLNERICPQLSPICRFTFSRE
jgi:hypothetical protein